MPSNKSKLTPKFSTRPHHEWSFEAIGTRWWVGVYQPLSAQKLAALQQNVAQCIETFDKTYSRFRADSLVTRIAQQAGEYSFPGDADALFVYYRQLYEATDGKVTPLVGQVLSDAGYDAHYSFKSKTLTVMPNWDDVMGFKNGQLHTTQPVLLDFGAAGKGYAVDLIVQLLIDEDVARFCVDASGDMRSYGVNEPLKIGLENPDNASEVIGVVDLQNKALCGSSPNRRRWGDYHHIMDPDSLNSPQHLKAVWVLANTALEADGFTTALFFCEPAVLLQRFGFDYALLYADGSLQCSKSFPAELFT